MKTFIKLTTLLIFLSGCAWSNTDKTLITINGALMTVDMLQTYDIYRHDEYWEVNPIIDSGVDNFGKGFIPVYFLTSFALRYLIADFLPEGWRTAFLTTTGLVSGGLVVHNHNIGLRP